MVRMVSSGKQITRFEWNSKFDRQKVMRLGVLLTLGIPREILEDSLMGCDELRGRLWS
jgi:hypothetical protein